MPLILRSILSLTIGGLINPSYIASSRILSLLGRLSSLMICGLSIEVFQCPPSCENCTPTCRLVFYREICLAENGYPNLRLQSCSTLSLNVSFGEENTKLEEI